ncbi:amidase 1 isoform X3 [Elaeis guineensis]|uniref:amidase 1 isoform X3 n=1 Tax=Elaeis guineensis var. tenera TaxID=51953 RepID=UPI003C6D389B
MEVKGDDDYGAFIERFELRPPPHSPPHQPLQGLTFAVKDIFDISGHVTGFGSPEWARTHRPATSTSPVVLAAIDAGAICVGKTVMDEMAYSINGENVHYGTPTNPCAPDRVPGGSSSGSAVAVAAKLVDFSLGTDTGGSVRVPAAYCGIFGFRPSHGIISTTNVIPMAQSFDTVGDIINHENLGDYIHHKVPSLGKFMSNTSENQTSGIPSLAAISHSMRLLQRSEFKANHGEWVNTIKPNLGPGISERVSEALSETCENIEWCCAMRTELHAALCALLEDHGVLAIPTVPGPPPKLRVEAHTLELYRARAFSLLSIAGMSRFCQINIPLGMRDNLPVSVSLLARHGADHFLLNLAQALYPTLKEQASIAWELGN